jgi:peptidoglycan/LPS O-acetylase OafA/YrhL
MSLLTNQFLISGASAPERRRWLHPALSTYFDLVRFVAALTVMFSHYSPAAFGAPTSLFPGHDAVVVFFVLSGYVIAFAADGRDSTWPVYAVNRFSRLWSVSIPALCFGFLVACWLAPGGYASAVLSTLANAAFLGEWWIGVSYAPVNVPMWSLNYEAWYYLIFAVWLFVGSRFRYVFVGIACVAAGPKIMALAPIWVAGVLLYRLRPTVSRPVAIALLAFSVLGYAAAYHVHLSVVLQVWLKTVTAGQAYRLGPSTAVLSDYLVTLLTVANFLAVDNLTRSMAVAPRVRSGIAWCASFTLTIYLFHMPLLALLHDILQIEGAVLLAVVFPLLWGIGLLTEHRRASWREGLERLASRFSKPVPKPASFDKAGRRH